METNKRSEELQEEALRNEKITEVQSKVQAQELEAIDDFGSIKLIPTPNFTGCNSIGTLLPTNLANDTVRNLSNYARQFDLIDFIKEKLGYSTNLRVCSSFDSEQIEALVLAIKSFEKGNAFILGDMAGIGKGRICAGIMRYAYRQGLIPVFLSFKPYLFNDIYRDLQDIGFFGFDLNNPKEIAKPKPFILHPDGSISDRDNPDVAVFSPLSYANTNYVCQDITARANRGNFKMSNPRKGYDFNCVMLPYSTVSMTRTTIKQEFLDAIAPKSILIFDESHNAASAQENSNILKRVTPLVEKCKGVLFSSATYAKNPDVFKLYIIRTALRTAVPSLESINAALKVGGENVAEYIATGLVYEGQMIRRERSFGNCKKVTEYVGTRREVDDQNVARYINLEGEPQKQRDFYNQAIGYFKELRDFSRSDLARSGVQAAVLRKCRMQNKELADETGYNNMIENWRDLRGQVIDNKVLRSKKDVLELAEKMFIEQNRGKWAVVGGLKVDSINRYKSTFRENLFLAIKAKFAADKIIECLETPVNYTNIDGSNHTAPLKPVVAIKNTGEAIFNELKLQEGSIVTNDFSEYLKVVYKKIFRGTFTLRKVTNNYFASKQELQDRGTWSDSLETTLAYDVEFDDFADGGERVMEIQSRLNTYVSNIPFSAIDYLIDRINRKERSRIYYEANNRALPAKYGLAGGQYYKVGEVTAREYMLKRIGDTEEFEYVRNDRERSATSAFRNFNNGAIDVLIINVVGSTGGSIQSNPKEGVDIRPRNMITIQFEWDINVEVQKRGRVNRTGQVNSPTYTYIISQIPSELRTYLMFRKKLRKLDANTSADQSISSKSSEVTSVEGGVVEDILNPYGFEAFRDSFITLIENEPYKALYDGMKARYNTVRFTGVAEENEYRLDKFNDFIRELELYPTNAEIIRDQPLQINQEYFFNKMNKIYIDKIQLLKSLGTYQLELETKNYKAKLRQKLVVQLNSGSTIFSKPLFLADYFTLEGKDFLSKDKVEQKITDLCKAPDGSAITPIEYQTNLVESFTNEATGYIDKSLQDFDVQKPKREDYATEEEFRKDLQKFFVIRSEKETNLKTEMRSILTYLRFFTPGMAVKYNGNNGKFLGYSIEETTSRFKYTQGSIVFHFAFLTFLPTAKYRLSSARPILNTIKDETENFKKEMYELGRVQQQSRSMSSVLESRILRLEEDNRKIENWQPSPSRRIIRRFLSGNILSGIVYANNYLTNRGDDAGLSTLTETWRGFSQNRMTDWALTRFSTVDGNYETAIECLFDFEIDEKTQISSEDTNLLISVGSDELLSKIKEMPYVSDIAYRNLLNFSVNVRGENQSIQREGNIIEDLDYQKVVWNGDNNDFGIIPRSVCIYKKDVNAKEMVYVEIMNPYRVYRDAKVFYQAPDRNNRLYLDEELLNQYRQFEIDTMGSTGKTIRYARFKRKLSASEVKDLKKVKSRSDESSKSEFNLSVREPYEIVKEEYKVFIKTFVFDLQSNRRKLDQFMKDIHEKYNLSMNFKSSADMYWNVGVQADIADIKEAKSKDVFPEGEYVYVFTSTPSSLQVESIPNVIGTKSDQEIPPFGGVVLKKPIPAMQLRSYNLTPYQIPSNIKVQLLLSALTPEDKTLVVKKLTEIKEKDPDEIGEYLQEFIEPKTTDLRYFFGDMTIYEIGDLMKKYINEEDLSKLIAAPTTPTITEVQELTERTREVKSAVDLDDAEKFLMNLLR